MKNYLLLILLLGSQLLIGQKPIELKKKYFGTYKGEIASYRVEESGTSVTINPTSILLNLEKEQVELIIGKNKLNGNYMVLFEAEKYYVLDCKMEGQLAAERIVVYKKGKRISRDGLFPQPSADLHKVKT